MTKEQLEIENQQLKDKLASQTHLVEAVEVKDQEILRLAAELEQAQHKADAYRIPPTARVENLEKENAKLKDTVIKYKNLFYNMLKTFQGTIDTTTDLANYVEAVVESYFGQNKS